MPGSIETVVLCQGHSGRLSPHTSSPLSSLLARTCSDTACWSEAGRWFKQPLCSFSASVAFVDFRCSFLDIPPCFVTVNVQGSASYVDPLNIGCRVVDGYEHGYYLVHVLCFGSFRSRVCSYSSLSSQSVRDLQRSLVRTQA